MLRIRFNGLLILTIVCINAYAKSNRNNHAAPQEAPAGGELETQEKVEAELKKSAIKDPNIDEEFLKKNFPSLAEKYKGKVDAQFIKVALDFLESQKDLTCATAEETLTKTIKGPDGKDLKVEHEVAMIKSKDEKINQLLAQLGFSNFESAINLSVKLKKEFDALYANPNKTIEALGFFHADDVMNDLPCGKALSSFFYKIPPANRAAEYVEQAIKILKEKGNTARYNGETHKHNYPDLSVLGATSVAYMALGLPDSIAPEELPAQKKFSEAAKDTIKKHAVYLSHDTNGVDAESRSEPIDLLTSAFFDRTASDTAPVNPLLQRQIFKDKILHKLDPATYKTKIYVHTAYEDEPTIRIECTGQLQELKTEYSSSFSSVEIDGKLSGFVASESTIEQTLKEGKEVKVKCDDHWFSVRIKKAAVPDFNQFPLLTNHNYKNSNPEKIKAVGTFGLIGSMSEDMQKKMIGVLALTGYELKGITKTKDIKSEVKKDLKVSAFYFPTAHSLTVSEFPVGSSEGQRMVFVNKNIKPEVELVLFAPMPNCKNGMCENLSTKDILDVFQERSQCNAGRLTVMTVSCNADHTLQQWMSAFNKSYNDKKSTKDEMPIIIAPSRGFDTDSPEKIATHFMFPMNVLKLAAEGRDVNAITENLEQSGFKPKSNVGSEHLFKIFNASPFEFEVKNVAN